MPVRISEIPNLQHTQINAANMNASAASAPAQAWGNVAQSFAGVSKGFAGIALDLQNTENIRVESQIRTNLDEKLTDARVEIEKEMDPETRLRKMDEFLASTKGVVNDASLPPVLRDRLTVYHSEWASGARNQNALQTAQLTKDRAQATLKNEIGIGFKNRDWARVKRAHSDAVSAGVALPEQLQSLEESFNDQARKDKDARDIIEDPVGWIERNEKPPENGDVGEWQRNMSDAKGMIRASTYDATEKFNDILARDLSNAPGEADTINSFDDIDRIFGDQRPAVVAQFKAQYAKSLDAAEQARMRTPEAQAEVIGQASKMLDEYTIDHDNFDEQYAKISGLIQSLPDGSPARNELTRQLKKIQDGQEKEFSTFAEAGRKGLIELFKEKGSGKTKQAMSLQQAVSDGLLEDPEKLAATGLPEDSIAKIIKGGLTDAQRAEVFREEFGKLPKDSKNLESMPLIQRGAFEALRDRKGFSHMIEVENSDVAAKEDRQLGEILRQWDQWVKLSPDKINDEKAVSDKQQELIKPLGLTNFHKKLIKPAPARPVGPPAIKLDGPLPELPRDAPMDFQPGVLPPIE